MKAWPSTGTARAKRQGGDKRSHRIEAYRAVILAAVEAQVDITLLELAEMLRRAHGASFAPSTVWRFLDRHDITVKKAAHASEQQRPDVAKRREAWFDAQPDLDPAHLVFIDETGATTKMARRRGRSGAASGAGRQSRMVIGRDHHLHGCAAAGQPDRTDGA